jgi:hypothetical protein
VSRRDQRLAVQVALWTLAAGAAFTGVPAMFAPHAFYDSFPAGLSWVDKLPPYNQHLVSDVGGLYLGFAFLFAWCAVTVRRAVIVPVALAWIGVQALHTGYHVLHLEPFSTGAAISQTAGFAAFLVLPCVALGLPAAERRSIHA